VRVLHQQRGFTLLEVLVALAILSIALGALIQSGGQSAETVDHLRNKSLAHWVALNQAHRLQLTRAWPENRPQSGEEEMAERSWEWQMVVTPTADENLKRVEINAGLADSEQVLSRVVTLLARPNSEEKP